EKEGIINTLLMSTGLIEEPLKMLYNYGAIFLGMTYTLFPFMVLPLYSSIEKLDRGLLEAADDLGANSKKAFRFVTLPLTMPGVVAGSLLVFIPSLGFFFIPDLMGGGKQMIIGNLIKNQFLTARNWPFGAALSILLIVITLVFVLGYLKLVGGDKEDMGVM
ncbi:MAG: ABC transporter permease, partial [Vallitaleaceae bacterium]|nr:ABC transporter permease [Vallitaleaceae bacterium]